MKKNKSLPSTSLAHLDRVDTETDIEMTGSLSNKRRAKVDLPAPDGEDTTSINPRRAMAVPILNPLFDVLHLLAKLVDHRLQRQSDMGELNVGGFRTQRIRLTVKFLCKEIELAPGRVLARDQRAGLLTMGGKPVQLLAQIGLGCEHGNLLRDALFRHVRAGGEQLFQLRHHAFAQHERLLCRQRARFAGKAFDIADLPQEDALELDAFGVARAVKKIERVG